MRYQNPEWCTFSRSIQSRVAINCTIISSYYAIKKSSVKVKRHIRWQNSFVWRFHGNCIDYGKIAFFPNTINENYRSKEYCYVYGTVMKIDNSTLSRLAIVKKDLCNENNDKYCITHHIYNVYIKRSGKYDDVVLRYRERVHIRNSIKWPMGYFLPNIHGFNTNKRYSTFYSIHMVWKQLILLQQIYHIKDNPTCSHFLASCRLLIHFRNLEHPIILHLISEKIWLHHRTVSVAPEQLNLQ
jgi:hypothetical protein